MYLRNMIYSVSNSNHYNDVYLQYFMHIRVCIYFIFYLVAKRILMASSKSKRGLSLDNLLGGEVDKTDLCKLRNAGFTTVESIVRAPSKALERVHGLSPLVLDELQETSRVAVNYPKSASSLPTKFFAPVSKY